MGPTPQLMRVMSDLPSCASPHCADKEEATQQMRARGQPTPDTTEANVDFVYREKGDVMDLCLCPPEL